MLEEHKFQQQNIHQQITQAVEASENIIIALQAGELEAVKQYDDVRIDLVRVMSRYKNIDNLTLSYRLEFEKLLHLDKEIITISNKLRDEVLTHLREERTNKSGCVQYVQNQRL